MKKVIALSWDKLFLSCSQFESRLATITYQTSILSSSFAEGRAKGTVNSRWNGYLGKIASVDKFSFEEVCERFAYLKSLLASGYDLVVITRLEGHVAETVRDLMKEQGFSVPVISLDGYPSSIDLNLDYDIYINYDWFKLMPVIVITPDIYLVKSVMILGLIISKLKQIISLGAFAKNS